MTVERQQASWMETGPDPLAVWDGIMQSSHWQLTVKFQKSHFPGGSTFPSHKRLATGTDFVKLWSGGGWEGRLCTGDVGADCDEVSICGLSLWTEPSLGGTPVSSSFVAG